MEMLIKIEKNIEEFKQILLADETINRGSFTFREASSLGMKEKCYYCLISGTEEVCSKAKAIIENKAKIIEGRDKEKIIKKIREEEEAAESGFGAIFG